MITAFGSRAGTVASSWSKLESCPAREIVELVPAPEGMCVAGMGVQRCQGDMSIRMAATVRDRADSFSLSHFRTTTLSQSAPANESLQTHIRDHEHVKAMTPRDCMIWPLAVRKVSGWLGSLAGCPGDMGIKAESPPIEQILPSATFPSHRALTVASRQGITTDAHWNTRIAISPDFLSLTRRIFSQPLKRL